ncbi:regulatory [Fusarium longipes]|uniref:Regulatory n=1 Tax=Fusarium longipes TaxID=694270 RepID=A0A395SL10_9HYPO|nr:regulatory [Fusarium longipes]
MTAEPQYGSWSALPLFDRVASPDHAKDLVPDLNDYESPIFEVDLLSENYDNFPTYSLPTVDLTKNLLPDIPIFCFDAGFKNATDEHHIDHYIDQHNDQHIDQHIGQHINQYIDQHIDQNIEHHVTTSSGLLDAIPSQLIALPNFTRPSRCPFPNCKSVNVFDSGRDFRRHYRQHFKRFFCRYPECSQSAQDLREVGNKGFATRKDRARHESKHKPTVRCPWHDPDGQQCLRVFSRVDNMRDHYRRIHKS